MVMCAMMATPITVIKRLKVKALHLCKIRTKVKNIRWLIGDP